MNLLDRHIFKSVLFTCLAAMGLFAFVLILRNAVMDLLGYLLAGQLSVAMFAKLVLLLIPFVITYALPMGMLTGVLLTLGRLSADSEITAMRAAGLSLLRISRPVLLLGALGAALAFYVNFESMPWARVEYHKQLGIAIRANPMSFIVPKTFIRNFPGLVVYVGDRNGSVVRDVWIWKLDDQRRVIALERSSTGRVDYDDTENVLRITLTPAQVENRDKSDPEDFSKGSVVNVFGVLPMETVSLDRFFGREKKKMKTEWLTYAELRAVQAQHAARPASAAETEPERQVRMREEMQTAIVLQEKINLSLAVLTFVLVGVPLGIKVSRRETAANLGVALSLVLGYYLLTVMVKWLDRHPEYRPDLLLWVPNLLFLGLAVWLFRRIERRS